MDEADIDLRNATYGTFIELGRAPSVSEIAEAMSSTVDAIQGGWRRLHEGGALVLDGDGSIRMAAPFSAVPTAFKVEAGGRSWYANCAWDAFGIGAALHVDSRFETACPDCGMPIPIEVRGGRPDDETPVFHALVPATRWWLDIGFT